MLAGNCLVFASFSYSIAPVVVSIKIADSQVSVKVSEVSEVSATSEVSEGLEVSSVSLVSEMFSVPDILEELSGCAKMVEVCGNSNNIVSNKHKIFGFIRISYYDIIIFYDTIK